MVGYKTGKWTYFCKHSNLLKIRKRKIAFNNIISLHIFIYFITLFTCVTIASSTSPLNGLKTIALYLTG